MKIKFKKKKLRINLIIGVAWMIFGIINVLLNDDLKWSDYGYLVIGCFYLGQYFYNYKYQYLNIYNESIRKNGVFGFGKTINLTEIIEFKIFAGEYILKTNESELKINTHLIEQDSLGQLNKILSDYNLTQKN